MSKYTLTLKNVKHFPSLSEETEAFTATLYIDGKRAATCHNRGHGGATEIRAVSAKMRPLVDEAEAWARTIPDENFPTLTNSLDFMVSELLEDHLRNAEMQKHFRKGICVEAGGPGEFAMLSWRGTTLTKLLRDPAGRNIVRGELLRLHKDGRKVLNTNIPADLFPNAKIK